MKPKEHYRRAALRAVCARRGALAAPAGGGVLRGHAHSGGLNLHVQVRERGSARALVHAALLGCCVLQGGAGALCVLSNLGAHAAADGWWRSLLL